MTRGRKYLGRVQLMFAIWLFGQICYQISHELKLVQSNAFLHILNCLRNVPYLSPFISSNLTFLSASFFFCKLINISQVINFIEISSFLVSILLSQLAILRMLLHRIEYNIQFYILKYTQIWVRYCTLIFFFFFCSQHWTALLQIECLLLKRYKCVDFPEQQLFLVVGCELK